METYTNHTAVAGQVRKLYDHIFRKYSAQMEDLRKLKNDRKIDRYSYISEIDQAFDEFQTAFEREIAPLLRLLSVLFIAVFLYLQVSSHSGDIYRTRTRTRTSHTTAMRAARGRREA